MLTRHDVFTVYSLSLFRLTRQCADVRDEAVAEGLLLVEHLDGDGVPGVGVAGVVDLGEGAVAEDAAELVAAEKEAAALAVAGGARGGGGAPVLR